MGQELEFKIGAKTDVGMRRSNNEDCFALVPQIHLCVLSDGMSSIGLALLSADLDKPEGSCLPLFESEGWKSF